MTARSGYREGDPGGNRTRLEATRPDHIYIKIARRSGLSIIIGGVEMVCTIYAACYHTQPAVSLTCKQRNPVASHRG